MTRKPWQKAPDAPKRMSGRRAQERRLRWLRGHPLCVFCQAKGRVTAATEVDHVVSLAQGGADDESNFQSACGPCHARKSLAERGYRARQRIGIDGFPIDD